MLLPTMHITSPIKENDYNGCQTSTEQAAFESFQSIVIIHSLAYSQHLHNTILWSRRVYMESGDIPDGRVMHNILAQVGSKIDSHLKHEVVLPFARWQCRLN